MSTMMNPRLSRASLLFLAAQMCLAVRPSQSTIAATTKVASRQGNAEGELRRRSRLLQQNGDNTVVTPNEDDSEDNRKQRKSKHLKSRGSVDGREEKSKARVKGLKGQTSPREATQHPPNPVTDVPIIEHKGSDRDDAPTPPFGTFDAVMENAFKSLSVGGCQLNENGLYGTADALSDVYTVAYLYQTSVVAGTSMTQLDNFVIQDVDNAITTAILPSFFDCGNTRRGRHLQGGVVQAISSTPIDTFISSGLTCAKVIANADCYVAQGFCTVIATGFRDQDELEVVFKEAVQVALQGNAILSNVDPALILDVSALSDDLQTVPPIIAPVPIPTIPTSSIPVVSPMTGTPTGSITLAPFPPPIAPITFAPVPALPTRPIAEFTPPPSLQPVLLLPTVTTLPVTTTAAPVGTLVPAVPTVPVAPAAATTNSPIQSPLASVVRDNPSSDSGLEWWAWLFMVVAGGMLVLCCLMIFRGRQSSGATPIGSPNSNSRKKQQARVGNSKKEEQNVAARRDNDVEDHPYEPPPSDSYVPPGMGTFSITPPDQPDPDPEPIAKDEPLSTAHSSGPPMFVNSAPSFVNDNPGFVNTAPTFVNDTPGFVHNGAYDDDDEEEEEPEESYSEDVDDGAGDEEEMEGDYDDEEEDDDEEDDEVQEVEAEAFEEEGSFYEEEELFEHESQRSEEWGNAPQSYNSRF